MALRETKRPRPGKGKAPASETLVVGWTVQESDSWAAGDHADAAFRTWRNVKEATPWCVWP